MSNLGCSLGRMAAIAAAMSMVVAGCASSTPQAPAPAAVAAAPASVQPAPPPAPRAPRIVLRGVEFNPGSAKVRPGDAAVLDEAVRVLDANPSAKIDVIGFCDSVGGVGYNLNLSNRRALAVADYLMKHGVAPGRLATDGYGKSHFVASNATAEGRAQNRRVEMEQMVLLEPYPG